MLSSTFSTSSLLATTFLFINALTPIAAKGINCDGNSLCWGTGYGQGNIPQEFLALLKDVPDRTKYPPGSHIACIRRENALQADPKICMFTQGTQYPYIAADLKVILQDLVNHKCAGCGSAPLIRGPINPQTGKPPNDISTGQLTINFLDFDNEHKCDGLCSYPPQDDLGYICGNTSADSPTVTCAGPYKRFKR